MRLIEYVIVFRLLVIRVIHMLDEIIQYIEDVKSDLAEEMSAASIKADVVRQHIDGLMVMMQIWVLFHCFGKSMENTKGSLQILKEQAKS